MRKVPSLRLTLLVALAAALSFGGACDDDPVGIVDDADFIADPLTGPNERPDPVTTDATGTTFFDVDGSTIRFRLEVEDIENVTLAHIHNGDANTAGPIVVELFNAGGTPRSFTARGVLAESSFTEADFEAGGGITTLDALVDAMEAGTVYVNVHTSANPAGEIRGQIDEN